MGFWGKLFGNRQTEPAKPYYVNHGDLARLVRDVVDGYYNSNTGDITEDVAHNYSAVWCASRLLTETCKQAPLHVYRSMGERTERVVNHPIETLLRKPNPMISGGVFTEFMYANMINWGNGYAEIVKDHNDEIVELYPIHASRVDLIFDDNGKAWWEITNDHTEPTYLEYTRLFHVAGALPDSNGIGRSVISHASTTISGGLNASKYEDSHYQNKAIPAGILKVPNSNPTPEYMASLREGWNSVHKGSHNSGNIGILPQGLEFDSIAMSHSDAQFIESRQFSITEISRWYNVPPSKLHEHSRSTFNNIEHLSISFVTDSIVPWLDRFKDAVDDQLLPGDSDTYSDHVIEGLLRGDIESRMKAYSAGLVNGIYSINEVRAKENLNPIEGGDEHRVQVNTMGIDEQPEDAEMQSNSEANEKAIDAVKLTAHETIKRLTRNEEKAAVKIKTKEKLEEFRAKRASLIETELAQMEKTIIELGSEPIIQGYLVELDERIAIYYQNIQG